ncbi:hypothetical protein [Mycobacterium uberis]|uniref:hypothetical protein n=1 Tax=Mycobacterium uberis TaxID=2162698 RepID=UPI000E30AE66|nr:hypothetical protein [Mycobacterium uberis]
MLFGSVTHVSDLYFPDHEKHGALSSSMMMLIVNILYCGPAPPDSAAAIVFGPGIPDGEFVQMKKLCGGISALTTHLPQLLESNGGEIWLCATVTDVLVVGRVHEVHTESRATWIALIIVSAVVSDITVNELINPAVLPADSTCGSTTTAVTYRYAFLWTRLLTSRHSARC